MLFRSWRLLEPDGNFFEHQAFSLIGLQIEAMGDLDLADAAPKSLLPTRTVGVQGVELALLLTVGVEFR